MEKNFIIAAFAVYIAAMILFILRTRRIGIALFLAGFGLNLAASIHRGITAGHFPFSNMYETMTTLGACMFPFWLFSEYVLKSKTDWISPFLGSVILFPVWFTFDPTIKPLMPALQSNLFFPHVMTYLLSYAGMAMAMILSVMSLVQRARMAPWEDYERVAFRVTGLAFPLLSAGLILGAVWAKRAWGDYWSWDPKEVWSLNTWIVYLVYFHVRIAFGRKTAWVDVLNIIGFLAIVMTLLAVNLTRIFGGMHAYAQPGG